MVNVNDMIKSKYPIYIYAGHNWATNLVCETSIQ